MKKTSCVVNCILVLFFSVLLASTALAECKTGKVEVTIVKGNGMVMELCVAEAALPHIGGESDLVIKATCPCFSTEDIEAALYSDPALVCETFGGLSGPNSYPCGIAYCEETAWVRYFPEGEEFCTQIDQFKDTDSRCKAFESSWEIISEDEALACAAIINSYVQ